MTLKEKPVRTLETRGGVRCLNTGADGTRVWRLSDDGSRTYVRVQLLPSVPQRLEWVNEANLKGA